MLPMQLRPSWHSSAAMQVPPNATAPAGAQTLIAESAPPATKQLSAASQPVPRTTLHISVAGQSPPRGPLGPASVVEASGAPVSCPGPASEGAPASIAPLSATAESGVGPLSRPPASERPSSSPQATSMNKARARDGVFIGVSFCGAAHCCKKHAPCRSKKPRKRTNARTNRDNSVRPQALQSA